VDSRLSVLIVGRVWLELHGMVGALLRRARSSGSGGLWRAADRIDGDGWRASDRETGPATAMSVAKELLERSDELAVLAGELADVVDTARGRLVLIAGEAGIGKTALVGAFCSGLGRVRVLSGACDALHTPRALGLPVDIAGQLGGELAELVEGDASPSDLLAALAMDLRRRSPTVLVFEDLHWADEATLDFVRLLGRRIQTVPALVLATYRDDQLDRAHPLRIVLGELPPGALRRLALAPLSVAAVATLAGPRGTDPRELYRRTAGNPFYVTEALAAGGVEVPDSVRDAVLARAARLDDRSRALLDAVAVVPARTELWLLEVLAGEDLAYLEICLASGMLRSERDAVAFRHEIARLAVEEALPPDRMVALHRRVVKALTRAPGVREDAARIAHHAEAAGDRDAALRYAPAAGERAAAVGAHREAAAQFARALRFAEGLESGRRAELLERRSYECYLTGAIDEAIVARRQALAVHSEQGDRLREGDARRWLSRLAWFAGDNTTAHDESRLAIGLLEELPPGPELAMAYSNMAQLRMLADDFGACRTWGARAIELADRLGHVEIVIQALNNVGTAELSSGVPDGVEKVERSLALALDAGLDEHVARAHTNLGSSGIELRDYALGDRHLEAGIAYCRERDLDSWLLYMTGWRARSLMEQGHWDLAAAAAATVLDRPGVAAPSRITPLVVLGHLRARRGDPDPWSLLDEASELALATGELQRLAPVAAARAEARWLAGASELVGAETEVALALAVARGSGWVTGELCVWRRRAGITEIAPSADVAEPYRLELASEPEPASRLWQTLGCPYESALALASSRDEVALRRSLAELQRLGARRLQRASRARCARRALGVCGTARAPRPGRTLPG
jgi:tetratricopeptide (TPR) repeat protein